MKRNFLSGTSLRNKGDVLRNVKRKLESERFVSYSGYPNLVITG